MPKRPCTNDARSFLKGSLYKKLSNIYIALIILTYADTDTGPVFAEDIVAVPSGCHECCLGFFHSGMVGNVFANGLKGITKTAEHIRGAAIGWGIMGKILILFHVAALYACYGTQDGVEDQGSSAVGFPILIEQKKCNFLLLCNRRRSIIITCGGCNRWNRWFFSGFSLRS